MILNLINSFLKKIQSQHKGFTLIELCVALVVFGGPLVVWKTSPAHFLGAKRLERFGDSVLVYKDPQTYELAFPDADVMGGSCQSTILPVSNWTISAMNDFVTADLGVSQNNPAFFSKNAPFFSVVLWGSSNFNTNLNGVCDTFDFTDTFNSSNVTHMEYVHSVNSSGFDTLHWDNFNKRMHKTRSPIGNCVLDIGDNRVHSHLSSATITAIAEDRWGLAGGFFIYDLVSDDILLGSIDVDESYSLFITRRELLSATGESQVDLSGSLTSAPNGDLYAWDKISKSLLKYSMRQGTITQVLTQNNIQVKTGGDGVNIVDIDYLISDRMTPNEAVVLLDSFTGSVLLYFPSLDN